jgi:hypothetical protein
MVSMTEQVKDESLPRSALGILGTPVLRAAALPCVLSIFKNFFLLQYRAALFPWRIPVSGVDHPLDEKIPFVPRHAGVYLDFTGFWIRAAGFLHRRFGRKLRGPLRDFIASMGELYAFAAAVYRKNLSTTRRPFYVSRPRFLLIHCFDPHLMCVPSLHVMVVIHTAVRFRDMLRSLGEEDRYAPQIEEIYRGSLAIPTAVLFVKQHSVNCIAAAMYAVTRFDGGLFTPQEGAAFVSRLLRDQPSPGPDIQAEIREHILSLYRRFCAEGEAAPRWEAPLLKFLGEFPKG